MSRPPVPLFVDTGALYATYDEDDEHHERAGDVVRDLRSGEPRYGPVFTSRYVLAELATVVLYQVGHREAVTALEEIRASSTFNVLGVDPPAFDAAADQFARYDDQRISFVDHLTGILAEEHGIEHVFAFDADFETLGFTVVPGDTGTS